MTSWAARALAGAVWLSSALFGVYILVFYAFAVVTGDMARWNEVLPLYEPDEAVANGSMGLHFLGGGSILVLGSVQFVQGLRQGWPGLHRGLGRVYVAACLAAATGGLLFIVAHGTIGGLVMDVGFAGYGLGMLLCAVQTARHAAARRLDAHRAWAVRLYALAIGSWLYRMDYGFWLLLTDGLGHTRDFRGGFDVFMAFWFYLPNLVVAELWLRSTRAASWWADATMALATAFVTLGTYFFLTELWLPAILSVVR
ncbi:MAG: DUF2306 domain-containing protein [Myxococcales bacterium]|nr:DUF2306 domain-containing protein [Myxococcales bacterium]